MRLAREPALDDRLFDRRPQWSLANNGEFQIQALPSRKDKSLDKAQWILLWRNAPDEAKHELVILITKLAPRGRAIGRTARLHAIGNDGNFPFVNSNTL
jgi:hypothetical protein